MADTQLLVRAKALRAAGDTLAALALAEEAVFTLGDAEAAKLAGDLARECELFGPAAFWAHVLNGPAVGSAMRKFEEGEKIRHSSYGDGVVRRVAYTGGREVASVLVAFSTGNVQFGAGALAWDLESR